MSSDLLKLNALFKFITNKSYMYSSFFSYKNYIKYDKDNNPPYVF